MSTLRSTDCEEFINDIDGVPLQNNLAMQLARLQVLLLIHKKSARSQLN